MGNSRKNISFVIYYRLSNNQCKKIMDFESICYKNAVLNQVIIRIDFLEFVPSDELFTDLVLKAIVQSFPKVGMRQIMRYNDVNVVINEINTTTQSKSREGFQQEFSDIKNNKIKISNRFLILEVNKYNSFEETIQTLTPILQLIINLSVNAIRTGIRYINIIDNSKIRLTKNLFSTSVSHLVNIDLSNEKQGLSCIRSMCMNEYRISDMHLNFRYGMYNPEYPSSMRSPKFVLDYDCYCDSLLSGFDILLSHIKEGHNAIQYLFENSISDNLRKIMNNDRL